MKLAIRIFITCLGIGGLYACKNSNLIDQVKHEYTSKAKSVTKSDHRELLEFEKKYKAVIRYRHDQKFWKVNGYVDTDMYGNSFSFDVFEAFLDYKFMTDNEHCNYCVVYSKENEKYIEMGTPSVGHWDTNDKQGEKRRIIVLLAQFPRKELTVQYSMDTQKYNEMKLVESKIMPYLLEGSVYLDANCKKIYLKINAEKLQWPLEGLNDHSEFVDSVTINN